MDLTYNASDSGTLVNTTLSSIVDNTQASPHLIGNIAHKIGKLSYYEYAAVIAILAVFVLMAIVFTVYGLFMKAEAHKHSELDHAGFDGPKESLLFADRDSYFPWNSNLTGGDDGWP